MESHSPYSFNDIYKVLRYLIDITIDTDLWENGYAPKINWNTLGLIIVVLLAIICSIYYIYLQQQRRPTKTKQDERCLQPYENKIIKTLDPDPVDISSVSYKQIYINYDLDLFLILTSGFIDITSVEIYSEPTIEITQPITEQVLLSNAERKLICYCDGSYSRYMSIGTSGFRASDGGYRYRLFSSGDPRYGSVDAEVQAAYFAIEYASKKHYNKLVIYTDNSKVEQLLKRRKPKDCNYYPDICQILDQCNNQPDKITIEVNRVRGHTSRYEQKNCKTKAEFAKIDRTVRKKTRQFIKKYRLRFQPVYYNYYVLDRYFYYF
ncbi:unnamed protein product [Adineta steineri]|uniref:RNase H type-1 domain-containing protein n=1 Tax=Adineta steineri TaxID=433720 RepID=A0A813TA84_9BILA|nr:unnamed protein product [Adineta steineri]CAF4149865.1 unnamed protein product [Adineta steineri]